MAEHLSAVQVVGESGTSIRAVSTGFLGLKMGESGCPWWPQPALLDLTQDRKLSLLLVSGRQKVDNR